MWKRMKKAGIGWKRIKEILIDLKVHPHEVEFLTKDKNLAVISKNWQSCFNVKRLLQHEAGG